MTHSPTPLATKVILVVVLAITIAVDCWVASLQPLRSQSAAGALAVFTMLFLVRVLGQVVVVLRQPQWLPPMRDENWNLVPYHLLLPAQLLILVFMAFVIVGVRAELAPFGARRLSWGLLLMALSLIYVLVMALRYVVRMRRRPEQRWFGGAIPIVFHMVLASFLFTWGRFLGGR